MRALVVEDEAALRTALTRSLRAAGWEATEAATGHEALTLWSRHAPQVVLLDLGLPDMDGLDVLQSARRGGHDAPVLLLTARGTIGDRVLGLNFGADDYLLKPFDLGELHARLRALLRRTQRPAHPPGSARAGIGRLVRDEAAGGFRCGARLLDLTPREAALLGALVQRPHRAVPKQALLEAVFPGGGVNDEALEVVAHRLRRKLGGCGLAIVSLRGLGYLIKDQGG